MPRSTDRQNAVVNFVVTYREQFHVGPSYAEIAREVGYASPSAARKAVLNLCEEKRLARIGNIARSIYVPAGADGD